MKLCLITAEYPPMRGGVADYTRILAGRLQESGVEVAVVSSVKAAEASCAFKVFPLVNDWGFRSWPTIERLLRLERPDIVHIQYQTAAYGMKAAINLLPFWLHRRLRCRVVTTFHDLRVPYLFPKAGPLRRWVNARLLRDSDAAILTNEEDRARAEKLVPGSMLSLIPIGSNVEVNQGADVSGLAARLRRDADEVLVCYFGMLNESKGVEFLLQAMRRLLDRGLKVRLLMLGEALGDADPTNVAYRKRVLDIIDALNLKDALTVTGYLREELLSAHLLASDICVLPFNGGGSFRRGSLLAALSHGLPIVTTQPLTPNLLSDGENCLLVPPGDGEAIAVAVERLISERELREKLRQGALELASHFCWQSIARQTIEIYSSLIKT